MDPVERVDNAKDDVLADCKGRRWDGEPSRMGRLGGDDQGRGARQWGRRLSVGVCSRMVDEHDMGDHLIGDAQSNEEKRNRSVGMKDNSNHVGGIKHKMTAKTPSTCHTKQKRAPRIAQQDASVLIASADLVHVSDRKPKEVRKTAKAESVPDDLDIHLSRAQASIPNTINRIQGGQTHPPHNDKEDRKRKGSMRDADGVTQKPEPRRGARGVQLRPATQATGEGT